MELGSEADWGSKPRRRRCVRGGDWVGKRRITEEKERSEKVDGGSTTIDREGVWLHVHKSTSAICSTFQSAAEREGSDD